MSINLKPCLPALVAACLIVAGCEEERPVSKPSAPPTVIVTKSVVRKLTDREEFTGRTDAVYSVDVLARVSGYLDKVLFKDGEEVNEGDVLFEIDPRPYQAEVARTESAVTKADAHLKRLEADFQRASHLYDRQVIGREEFDLISGDRDEAKAVYRNAVEARKIASLNLEWTKVTARISGLASRRMVDPGALIKASETVMTNIVTQDPLYFYFDVDERTLLRLRRLIHEGTIQSSDGKAVSAFIGLADEDDYPKRGIINFSENKTDSATGTLRIRGTIENPKPYMLNPGMYVNVRLPVGELHDFVMVPDQAIGTDQGRKFVYVVNERDEVVYRPVTIGFLDRALRVVESGLKPGERVITTGIQRIRPGLKVVPETADRASSSWPKTADAGEPSDRARLSTRN
ncbi:MAG: efflux RND transporter periplasmic adaptor subunit [Isosphaeraceae bacterium]|nr:efflux RND transporter periplasmic adaptor subunit [Isosphaeraceae bacterium]